MKKFIKFLRWVFPHKATTEIVTEKSNDCGCECVKPTEKPIPFEIIDIKTDPGFRHAEIEPTIIEEVKTIKKKPIVKKSTEQIVEELKEVDKQKVIKKVIVKKDIVNVEKNVTKTIEKPISKKSKKKKSKK